MRALRTTGLLALTLAVVPWGSLSAQETATGEWTARDTEDGVRLRLVLDSRPDDWGWGSRLDAAQELLASADSNGEIDWSFTAPAGRIDFEGEARGNRAMGDFTFRADPDFRDEMRSLGIRGRMEVEELLSAALHEVSADQVRELRGLGFDVDEFDELLSSAIFSIDRAFVTRLRAEGLDGDLDDFTAFSIHGVTPAFVREVEEWDVGSMNADDFLAFRIHGVTPAWIEEMHAAGFDDLDNDELVAGRIHGVSPAFAESVADWGFARVDFDDLVAMRIHGVSADWLDRMDALDMRPETVDDALSFRIHGVSPGWIEELREMGYDDLSADDLIQIRIHGLDRILRRRGGGR